MKTLLRYASLLILLTAALATVGCKDNPAATKACKGAGASSDACSACCKSHGANGHKYINGDCSCLGG